MEAPPPSPRANRLAACTSPYLLQHAHNPVDWYPWGEEALSRARADDRPILLSVGYSACHWCHVMERESFEDEATAALMNAHFVCVKVDREERPDLDDVYMAATVALNRGQGGWPMTVFLTPEKVPFFAGTYFPPEDRQGRPGFRAVLAELARLWATDRARVLEQAAEVREHLRRIARPLPPATVGEDEIRQALSSLAADFDPRWGGFGGAPKFPPAAAISLLLRGHRRFGDASALQMAWQTLDGMAQGGLRDHLGGGFHRYSTDERWLVPHFEKMLYDNAALARAYLEGWQATGEAQYRRVAVETLDYLLAEMRGAEGGFFSATDADSEGEEGRFFVWTPEQVAEVLEPELARRFCAFYDVTEEGNWEGRNVLNTPRPLREVARRLGVGEGGLERSLAEARRRLCEARARRTPPALDDKVVAGWNGLAIGALAEAHGALGEPRHLSAARRAADFVLGSLRTGHGRLARSWRAGRAQGEGFLEDHAYLADALVDLYEAGAPTVYLREAERLAERVVADFAAGDGAFHATARDQEELIVRPREGHDGATASPNAVAARALARLSFHLGREDFREAAALAVRAWGRAIARSPRAFPTSLGVVELLLDEPLELVFVGRKGGDDLEQLRRAVGSRYLPQRVVVHHDASSSETPPLLAAGKGLVEGRAALYVCREGTCRRPITDPAEVEVALAGADAGARAAGPGLDRALPGFATAQGTASRAAGLGPHGSAPLGTTGLLCSRLGFGTYRVDDETAEHGAALARALEGGCNLVDTSTNYTDGASERLVGDVLTRLCRAGRLTRAEVVVVSKMGYLQGECLARARRREAEGRPFPEVVHLSDGLWHCLHPEFLAEELTRSLERLQLQALDACLLHNPEYLLKEAARRSPGAVEAARDALYRRVEAAFGYFEEQVRAGRLAFYGVSSNTVASPPDDPERTSLARFLAAARAAGGAAHHFRVLELPLNLLEPAAALDQGEEGRTVLEQAAMAGLAVLVNRPLNAVVDGRVQRLAEVEVPPAEGRLDDLTRVVGEMEEEFRRELAPRLRTDPGGLPPEQLLRWADELPAALEQASGVEDWDEIESRRVLPHLSRVLGALDRALAGPLAEAWHDWRERYLPELRRLFAEARRQASLRSRERAAALAGALARHLPAERRAESLSRLALWPLVSTPGVSCVLVGMRRPAYVDDALGVLAWPPLAGGLGEIPGGTVTRPPEPT